MLRSVSLRAKSDLSQKEENECYKKAKKKKKKKKERKEKRRKEDIVHSTPNWVRANPSCNSTIELRRR